MLENPRMAVQRCTGTLNRALARYILFSHQSQNGHSARRDIANCNRRNVEPDPRSRWQTSALRQIWLFPRGMEEEGEERERVSRPFHVWRLNDWPLLQKTDANCTSRIIHSPLYARDLHCTLPSYHSNIIVTHSLFELIQHRNNHTSPTQFALDIQVRKVHLHVYVRVSGFNYSIFFAFV